MHCGTLADSALWLRKDVRDQGVADDHCERRGCALAGRCSRELDRAGGGSGGADDDCIDREAIIVQHRSNEGEQAARTIPELVLSGPPRL